MEPCISSYIRSPGYLLFAGQWTDPGMGCSRCLQGAHGLVGDVGKKRNRTTDIWHLTAAASCPHCQAVSQSREHLLPDSFLPFPLSFLPFLYASSFSSLPLPPSHLPASFAELLTKLWIPSSTFSQGISVIAY